MKHAIPTSLPPNWNPSQPGFSHAAWNRKHGQRLRERSQTSVQNPDFRKDRARILFAKLNRGELSASAAAGVERDYAREFKRFRAKKNFQKVIDNGATRN